MSIITKKNIKVVLVLPSLTAGGMERVMSELANYFCKQESIEVHLVLFGRSPKLFYNIDSRVIIHKTKITPIDRLKPLLVINRILFIRSTIKSINPKSVLSFGTQWNNLVLLSLFNSKIRVFVSDRGSPNRKYKISTELWRKLLYPHASGIIYQTKKAKIISNSKFPNIKSKTIGNPVKIFDKINNYNSAENIILSIGRLITSKNHDRLIKIFTNLNAPEWKLMIVGGDALKENNFSTLSELIRKYNMENRIILAGEQKDINKYLLRSKIFAFTSDLEGFPNVIGEAMSAGLPVIAYDCDAGPSEMIIDGVTGFLVPLFDDVKFQNKLQLLINDEKLRQNIGRKASENINKFSVESVGNQYLDFILNS